MVLSRISQRSTGLLSFIAEYSKLTQLPPPNIRWFSFRDALNEASGMTIDTGCRDSFQSNEQCYGDAEKIIQVLINLLKNSVQACEEEVADINIRSYFARPKNMAQELV